MQKANLVSDIFVTKRNGNLEKLDLDKINKSAERACENLPDVSVQSVVEDAHMQFYDKIQTAEIDKALILSARTKIEQEPSYSYVAARLLLNNIYKEVFGCGVEQELFKEQYRQSFIENINELVDAGRLDERMLDFDLDTLAENLVLERDNLFKYLGIQTLYDRYFIHIDGVKKETPQAFFMRIAMGLSLNEKNKTAKAIEFYHILSQFLGMNSTPTLFNSGTTHPQLSSCFLSTIDDSLDGIMGTMNDQSKLSKYAGGLGVDFTPVRGMMSHIKGTNGRSSGVVPFMKIFNSVLLAFNQSGLRNGSGAAYLETWHIDFPEFLDLRKETGDDRRRTHDMNTAAWVSDLFMEKVKAEEEWFLFSPDETPDLHSLYGKEFEKRYAHYVRRAKMGKIKNFTSMPAKELFKKMIVSLAETGHPWICFKDASNICYSNKNEGVVNSSNLCTEILRHTLASLYNKEGEKIRIGETAVCNLASINYKAHLEYDKLKDKWRINKVKLAKTVTYLIRMLDNVIDLNYYTIPEAKKSNMAHRPIGLGKMGFVDVLHAFEIPYESQEAVELASELDEFVSYHAIKASCMLAKERGAFSTFEGSEWSEGNLPQDMFDKLFEERGKSKDVPSTKLGEAKWNALRSLVTTIGVRNASILATAPTATISYICGCRQSIEPDPFVLFSYGTLSGSFTMIDEWFVEKAKKDGLWSKELLQEIKEADGNIAKVNVPEKYKKQFKSAFDMDYKYLVDAAAARQQWIDMSQSFNIYNASNSIKEKAEIYLYCYEKGLKTTYYFRSLGASTVEKSTTSKKDSSAEKSLSLCSIEARLRGEECESCQ